MILNCAYLCRFGHHIQFLNHEFYYDQFEDFLLKQLFLKFEFTFFPLLIIYLYKFCLEFMHKKLYQLRVQQELLFNLHISLLSSLKFTSNLLYQFLDLYGCGYNLYQKCHIAFYVAFHQLKSFLILKCDTIYLIIKTGLI